MLSFVENYVKIQKDCKEKTLKSAFEINEYIENNNFKKIICQTILIDGKTKTEFKVCLK